MQLLSLVKCLIVLLVFALMPACGSGGDSDTAGALTMTTPTSTDNKDGTYDVTTTVTYAPPAGKSAQGVVITTTKSEHDILGNSLNVVSDKATLTSGSNSVIYSFNVKQQSGASTRVSIESSIGSMTASVGITIPEKPATITP